MSDFYTRLSEHYDRIFPMEQDIVSFLAKTMFGRKRLLDLACGTGTYTEPLAQQGFNMTGVDLDEAMIATAMAKRHNPETEYVAADMISGMAAFTGGFDGAFCIGNSLPHLDSLDQISEALKTWFGLLAPGGCLALQIVNFDRFAAGVATDLPTIDGDGLRFERRYLPSTEGKVTFSTTLHVTGDSQSYTNAIELLIVKHDVLEKLVLDSGFVGPRVQGSYSGQEYNSDKSFLNVCVAEKPS